MNWDLARALFLLCLIGSGAFAQSLTVENVRFEQQIDHRVVVHYDLIGESAKEYTVVLSLFNPESRKKIPLTGKSVQGESGRGVKPGRDLKIIWDLKQDFPGGLDGQDFRFVVDAFIEKKVGGGKGLPWFIIGAAAAGGGTLLYFTSRIAGAQERDLPGPPALPVDQ